MKTKNTISSILLLVFFSCMACQQKAALEQQVAATNTTMNKPDKIEKLLRHVVIFKFNDESSEEDVSKLNDAFNELAGAIPVVQDFEWGINHSPENFHQDFTHCYLLTFKSEADRDSVYTPHPMHQAFVKSLGPHIEKVFVVDYWTNP